MRSRNILVGIALAFSVEEAGLAQPAPAAASSPTVGLPPIPCVEAVRLGRIAREAGDFATARTKLEATVDLPGCELPALAAILPLLRFGGYPPDRAAALRERLTTRIADPAVEVPLGLLTHIAQYGVRGDDEMLLTALEKRLAGQPAAAAKVASPELVELLDVTATLQEKLQKPEAARDTLGRLLALAPTETLRWRALGLDARLERWASAAELLVHMVDAPDAPAYLRELYVSALAKLGRYDEMLKQVDRLAPAPVPSSAEVRSIDDVRAIHFVDVLLGAAWALRDAGRDAEAQAILRRVLALEPGRAEAQLALLHLYGTAEERAAQAAAVAARRESETDPLPLFEEGSDLLGAGDLEGARKLLARAAPELKGTDYAEPAWYNLGTAAFKLERWEEAAQALGEAIAVNPARSESHYKRGIALFHLERCKDAVAALQRTLELQADKKDAHFYLAGCYTKLGDTAAAARHRAIFNKP